jgi:hypothetical protein
LQYISIDLYRFKILESADTVQQIIDKSKYTKPGAKLFLIYKSTKNLVLELILALQDFPETCQFLSPNSYRSFFNNFLRYILLVDSDKFNTKPVTILLKEVVNNILALKIWNIVRDFVVKSIPLLQLLPNINQTLYLFNTSSFVNISKYRKYIDNILKVELGSDLYIGVPCFYKVFFEEIKSLKTTAAAVFIKF